MLANFLAMQCTNSASSLNEGLTSTVHIGSRGTLVALDGVNPCGVGQGVLVVGQARQQVLQGHSQRGDGILLLVRQEPDHGTLSRLRPTSPCKLAAAGLYSSNEADAAEMTLWFPLILLHNTVLCQGAVGPIVGVGNPGDGGKQGYCVSSVLNMGP